jgi:hypothetical protein
MPRKTSKVKEKAVDAPPATISQTPLRKKRSFILFGIVLIGLFLLGVLGYLLTQNQVLQGVLGKADKDEVDVLVEEIGSIIALPTGEVPTIATVSDKTKLSDQAFFRKAENGDKVLIYANAKRAILYRPSMKKIIDVTTIDLGNSESAVARVQGADTTATPSATPTNAPIRVVIYNGTKVAGLAARAQSSLHSLDSQIQVAGKTNSSLDYEESLVIDLKGSNKAKVEELAKEFKGSVGVLPEGESVPSSADILLILGSSYAE